MRAAKKTIKMLPEIFRCLAAPNRQTKFPVLLAAFVAASAIVRAAEQVPGPDFTREVLPILSQHCFNCHGPDENSRKAGLRLDVREAALQSGDSDGAAIVPGQPDASALLARVLSHDPDEVMPPPKEKKSLSPTQIDTWDPKPELQRLNGKTIPGQRNGTAFGSPFNFVPQGQSGLPISPVWHELGRHADKLAVIRSMHTDIPAHDTAQVMFNTGSLRRVMPSAGSWVLYGLGSENQSLPGFVALSDGNINANNLRSAFLPGAFQGTQVDARARRPEDLIANIRNSNVSMP